MVGCKYFEPLWLRFIFTVKSRQHMVTIIQEMLFLMTFSSLCCGLDRNCGSLSGGDFSNRTGGSLLRLPHYVGMWNTCTEKKREPFEQLYVSSIRKIPAWNIKQRPLPFKRLSCEDFSRFFLEIHFFLYNKFISPRYSIHTHASTSIPASQYCKSLPGSLGCWQANTCNCQIRAWVVPLINRGLHYSGCH